MIATSEGVAGSDPTVYLSPMKSMPVCGIRVGVLRDLTSYAIGARMQKYPVGVLRDLTWEYVERASLVRPHASECRWLDRTLRSVDLECDRWFDRTFRASLVRPHASERRRFDRTLRR